jgi:hypothetical protein
MSRDHEPAPRPWPTWPLALALAVELVAVWVFTSPQERFSRFAYHDSGADLTTHALTARGLRPGVDFGYIYGLLPLLINRAWYDACGATPMAFRVLTLACGLALAWALARYATASREQPFMGSTLSTNQDVERSAPRTFRSLGALVGPLLIVVTLPDMLQASTIVLVHALEPVLLVSALALQARGQRGGALALATAGLFVKPSMPYLYGLVLLASIVASERARAWRSLGPAVATGLGLAVLLSAVYGLGPLVGSLLPGRGLEVYRQGGYGFFRGAGRDFWLIPGGGLRDYLRYEVGAWLAATVVLAAGGLAAAVRVGRNRATRNDEMVLTCAVLHLGFVTLFFGNRTSWVYYYAVLVVGLVSLAARGSRHAAVVGLVVLLVVVGSKAKFETVARLWKTDSATAATLGLWASPAERDEWVAVRSLVHAHGPAAELARVDGLGVLLPEEFLRPEVAYLVPGHPVAAEVRRKADQLATAAVIVRARSQHDPARGGYERWPEIAAALDGCETVFEGPNFEVARRARPPGSVASRP